MGNGEWGGETVMPITLYPIPCRSRFLKNFLDIGVIILYILPFFSFQPLHTLLSAYTASNLLAIWWVSCVCLHVYFLHTYAGALTILGCDQCSLLKNEIMMYALFCILHHLRTIKDISQTAFKSCKQFSLFFLYLISNWYYCSLIFFYLIGCRVIYDFFYYNFCFSNY